MHLVLSWPVRLFIVLVLVFSIFVDGAGYIYRIVNHYPLTGNAPGLPPTTLRDGQAKMVLAGSDIILQLHYTPNGKATSDITRCSVPGVPPPSTKSL